MKKIKFTLTILFSALALYHAHSFTVDDVVFEGDVTLSTQAEVDAFDYTEVTGALTISGNDITNLNGLSTLTRVLSLTISGNGSLTNVDGLSALSQVGFELSGLASINILSNPVLTNLNGLSSLVLVHGPITIGDNASLETINGFSGLSSISFGLDIYNNPQLKSINGFKQVGGIGSFFISYLIIDNNASLTNIDGLSSISYVYAKSSAVQIKNNASLLNIDGLSSLNSIGNFGSSLEISNNPALKNINGLSSLSVFGYSFLSSIIIHNNATLENIDGLSGLTYFEPFAYQNMKIHVTENPVLSQCSGLYPMLAAMGTSIITELVALGNINVSQNGSGCTVEDILANGPQTVLNFTVIDASTGNIVALFYQDSATLDLAFLNLANLALQVNTFPEQVGSVTVIFDEKMRHTDSASPYQFSLPFQNKAGAHTVKAEVYSGPHKKGVKGVGRNAIITVVNSAALANLDASSSNRNLHQQGNGLDISVFPVPVDNELYVKIDETVDKDALLTIRNVQGLAVYKDLYSNSSSISTMHLQPGVYLLQVSGRDGSQKTVRFIKK